MFNTLSEAKAFIAKEKIQMLDLMTIDINGRWRHLTMPAARLTEDILQYGIGFDASNYGYAPVEKSDMVFIPDLKTAYLDSFAEIPALAVLGDVFVIDLPSNRRFDQDPRNIALCAEKILCASGIADEFRIAPEYEFYVFDNVRYTVDPQYTAFRVDTSHAVWNTGADPNLGYKVPHKGGYHVVPPSDRFSDFRGRVCAVLEEMGIAVKCHHHEGGGPGQCEIEVEAGGLLEMSDKTMIIKHILKNAAFKEGKTVTFLPKPLYGEGGSGLHVHMQLFKGGQPLFYDENGYSQLSQTALYFMGGILKHIAALCAFTNPSTNSYKRLIPGFEAPVTVGYATSNRSAVVRIPAYAKSPETKRYELRSPDGTCNPYYAFAAILMAGIDGVKNKIDPAKAGYGPYDFNLYALSDKQKKRIKSLPRTLDDALYALEKDHDFLSEAFPKQLIDLWLERKREETAKVSQYPHPIEYELYYDI